MQRMLLIPKSGNIKTGLVIASYTEKSSCPTRCPLKGNGCYAEGWRVNNQWNRTSNDNDPKLVIDEAGLFKALKSAALALSGSGDRVVFRHNVAGDIALPGTSTIDINTLKTVDNCVVKVEKLLKKIDVPFSGYSYTHCEINEPNSLAIKGCKSFVVSYSCESVKDVIKAKSYGIPSVLTSFNVAEDIAELKAVGIKAVQCPNQTKGIKCAECKLCAIKNRTTTVVFEIHGNSKAKAKKVIMLARANQRYAARISK